MDLKLPEYATEEEIRAATLRYCEDSGDDIEIDVPAKVSRADEGVWVQAWVWVPNEKKGN